MKTAEQILKENNYSREDPEIDYKGLVRMLNEAMKGAIIKSAEVAVAYVVSNGVWMSPGTTAYIDKNPILNLLNDLKEDDYDSSNA